MAKVSFRLRSKVNKPVSIYIYASLGRGEMYQAKTGFTINPKDWSDTTKKPKQNSEENRYIFSELGKLEKFVYDKLNEALGKGELIDLNWLNDKIIDCFQRIQKTDSSLIVNHVQSIVDNASTRRIKGSNKIGLSDRRISGYKSFKKILEEYQKEIKKQINFIDINKTFVDKFTNWLIQKKKYSVNHSGKQIDNLKTVCRDAESMEIQTNAYTKHIEGFKERNEDRYITTLSFDELEKIRIKTIHNSSLHNARKWLLIGCEIGQRVSDLLEISNDNIRYSGNLYFADIIQKKTGKSVTAPIIAPHIIDIIENEFPYSISAQKLNKHIKAVCKLAEIDNLVQGKKYDKATKRKKLDFYPKHELITTHTFRRSFATNYYKKIPTSILINITGHSKESLFLDYINQREDKDENAKLFMKFYQDIHKTKESQLKLVKNA